MLETAFETGDPVTLPIRPEDLTKNQPQRATVNQTLGRDAQGWVDYFGEGLPSVTIAGHTGWRYQPGSGQDGFQAFEALNDLVIHKYATAKQDAIDGGLDPATVKLIFIDLLDNFSWSVVVNPFVLRRSKSRPLLYQYNMTLQAIDTNIARNGSIFKPSTPSLASGFAALDRAIKSLQSLTPSSTAALFSAFGVSASPAVNFLSTATNALISTRNILSGPSGLVGRFATDAINLAHSLSLFGRQVYWTISSYANLGQTAQFELSRIAAAFNEVACIFSHSLKPRKIYENYDPLFGASNCSSTNGGRMPSAYADTNPFWLINQKSVGMPFLMSESAMQSMSAVMSSDPVLLSMPYGDTMGHLQSIVDGTQVAG